MMARWRSRRGLGACCLLAHPLSSECGLHHGLANAYCLPAAASSSTASWRGRASAHVSTIFGGELQLVGVLTGCVAQLCIGLPWGPCRNAGYADKLDTLADLKSRTPATRSTRGKCAPSTSSASLRKPRL
jgi:hypothetical protein